MVYGIQFSNYIVATNTAWAQMILSCHKIACNSFNIQSSLLLLLVREPKSIIVQKCETFAPERYMAGFLYTDRQNSA